MTDNLTGTLVRTDHNGAIAVVAMNAPSDCNAFLANKTPVLEGN